MAFQSMAHPANMLCSFDLFYSHGLDLDLMTLRYESELHTLKTHMNSKNEVFTLRLSEVRA